MSQEDSAVVILTPSIDDLPGQLDALLAGDRRGPGGICEWLRDSMVSILPSNAEGGPPELTAVGRDVMGRLLGWLADHQDLVNAELTQFICPGCRPPPSPIKKNKKTGGVPAIRPLPEGPMLPAAGVAGGSGEDPVQSGADA